MNRKQVSTLLIEENAGDASLIREMLADVQGMTCFVACVDCLAAGLQRIAQGGIDLVLLGLGLSDGAGLDTLLRLRAGTPEALPVIVISGQDDQEVAVRAVQEGAQDFLVKGQFDANLLIRSIRYAIERQEARETLRQARTELERTRESLLQSERKFRAIFDQTFQLTGLLAIDGTIMEANRTALDFSGVRESDVVGRPFWEAPWWTHSREQQEQLRAAIRDAARGNFVRFEATHVTADGSLRFLDFSLKPVIDDTGHVILIIPEGRDITERRWAEDALWESSQRLRLVLENMPAFVFWKDRDSVYLGCNHLFAANAGLRCPEEIVGLTDLDLPWKSTEAESYRADDRRVMESGIPKLGYEETQLTADGRITDVRTSKIPLRNPEGEIIGVLGTFEDITERKRAEQMLAEAEAKYRCLVEESLVGVYLIQQGRFVYANACMAGLFGYRQEEVVGRRVEELVAPEDRVRVAGNVQKREAGQIHSMQYAFRGLRKDGKVIDVEVLGTRTVYNALPAVIGSLLDITERKRAEEALRESEAKYRRIVDTAGEGILMVGSDAHAYFVNARMAEMLGYSSEEMVGQPVTDFLFEEDLPDYQSKIENCRQGISENYERRFRRKDGQTVWTLASAVPIFDDGQHFVGSFAMYTDITERKHAEEALREERMLFIGGPAVAFKWQNVERWPVQYVSPNILNQFGYTPEDLTSGRISYGRIIHPDDLPRIIEEINTYCEAKVPCFEQEYRISRADGEYRWVYSFTVVVRDSIGAITHYHGHISDITDRKRAEEEQSKLRQHLQQAQKMEAVGHLAGGIAHDFNNILGIINGYSELLLQDPALQEVTRARIGEILTAGERAASLTRQLLAFSRKLVLKPKVLSLNLVIEGIDKMLRRLIGEEIEVRTLLAPDLECVRADPSQMEQVFLNFCINARDAMPDGGTITIETANIEVDEIQAAEHFNMIPGHYVRVTVTDTGIGMDRETLSHVFEPFFTTKGPERGTGLGLATVYGIVEQSGGHVWGCSEPGHGTTFFVYLPTAAEEVQTPDPEIRPQEAMRGSETILMVEDAAPLRALFRKVLEDNGYTVLEAEDGARAVQIADKFQGNIALLLTDVSLPKIKGPALARVLVQRRAGIRVLFVSGYTETAIAPDGVLESGSAFLQKPFTAEALIRKIREVLDAPRNYGAHYGERVKNTTRTLT